jgi:quinol monooxygenase YgiN
MAFVCTATWTAQVGREGIVRDALARLSPVTRTEPGNIYYQAYVDPEEPSVFHIFEVYTDAAAFEEHRTSPHFVEHAVGKAIPVLESREREVYATLDF